MCHLGCPRSSKQQTANSKQQTTNNKQCQQTPIENHQRRILTGKIPHFWASSSNSLWSFSRCCCRCSFSCCCCCSCCCCLCRSSCCCFCCSCCCFCRSSCCCCCSALSVGPICKVDRKENRRKWRKSWTQKNKAMST